MKFHKTSGKSAAPPETTSSSPSKSLSNNTSSRHGNDSELALPHGPLPRVGSHQMVFESISQPLNIGIDEDYVTSADITRRFKMSERTIRRNVRDYGMPAHPIGPRGVRFLVSEIQRWLDANARKRFAATGRAVTKAELQRRIAVIPILEGLQIVEATPTMLKASPKVAQGNALRTNASSSNALKGQSNTPRCKPGRKRAKPEPSLTNPCPSEKHRWSKGLHLRSCTVCGITQERNADGQWSTST